MNSFTVTTKHEISAERVANLLVSAFEGGSNYCYMIESSKKPRKFETYCGVPAAKAIEESPKVTDGIACGPQIFSHVDYPMNPGGHLIISSTEEEEDRPKAKLDLKAIQKGLQLFAESKTYAHHWHDFLAENDDAITADVFLQLCLYGEVIYG